VASCFERKACYGNLIVILIHVMADGVLFFQLETLRASCLSFLIRNLKYNPVELCKVYPTAKVGI